MNIIASHTVEAVGEQKRLSDYLNGVFPQLPSRSSIKKAINRGRIKIGDRMAATGDYIQPGMEIHLLEDPLPPPKPFLLELKRVFEDDYLAIVIKPAGIPVSGNQFKTIQNALVGQLDPTPMEDALKWPKPVHRLDALTSGLLVVAKTAGALMRLGKMFETKKVTKKYHAIVMGKTSPRGIIDLPIEDQESVTTYNQLQVVPSLQSGHLTWLEVSPLTGRTHQIRIHLSQLGYPIMGDKMYGKEGEVKKGKGLFLSAVELQFMHPVTGAKIHVHHPTPNKFQKLMEREQERWDKFEKEKKE